jgi:hypothetical protein
MVPKDRRLLQRPTSLLVAASILWAPTAQAALRVAPIKMAPTSVSVGAVGSQSRISPLALPQVRIPGLSPHSTLNTLSLPAAADSAAVFASGISAQKLSPEPLRAAAITAAAQAHAPILSASAGQSHIQTHAQPAKQTTAKPTALGSLKNIDKAPDAEPLWTGGTERESESTPVHIDGPVGAFSRHLQRSRTNTVADEDLANQDHPQVRIPRVTPGSRVRDWVQYMQITGSSLFWYTFPRLFQRWDQLKEQIDAAQAAGHDTAVRQFVNFFIAHRVQGSTGSYAPMGFRPGTNRIVVRDAWHIFNRYFEPDTASRDAFRRFIDRAKQHNPNRRSTQFRKILFHALRAGSVLPRKELPAFFDNLATGEVGSSLETFQRERQPHVLATFKRVVEETIVELNADLQPRSRIVGALLLGSFANNAAAPGSDFDVQTLTADGRARNVGAFNALLKKNWKSTEYADEHPVGGFQYALGPSKPLLNKIHLEPYIIISPYPEVVTAMSRTEAEQAQAQATSTKSFRGFLFQVAYSHLLLFVLAGYGARKFLRSLTRN